MFNCNYIWTASIHFNNNNAVGDHYPLKASQNQDTERLLTHYIPVGDELFEDSWVLL